MDALLKYFLAPSGQCPKTIHPLGRARDLCLISESDPSQEGAILEAKVNMITAIQGPPGTGKSQTIVNIIVDALYNNETILVVCEKAPALEVILKRMSSIGLGFLVNYVHDIKKDRLKIIDNIKTVLQNDHLLKSESKYISFRAEDSLRIDCLEKRIKDYNQFLDYKLGNLSITDIRAFQSIYGGDEILGRSKEVIKNQIKGYADLYGRVRDKESFVNYIAEVKKYSELYTDIGYSSNIFAEKNENIRKRDNSDKVTRYLKTICSTIETTGSKKDDYTHISWLIFSQYLQSEKYSSHTKTIEEIRYILNEYLEEIRSIITEKQYTEIRKQVHSTDIDSLRSMYDASVSLPKIAEIFGYLERNPEMIHIFDENPQYIQDSHALMSDVLFTILRDRIYTEIGYEVEDTSVDIERYKIELADLLKKEKEYRKNLLISKYKNRSEFARILENQDLLAKVKSKNRRKSTIRDIYTYKSESTGTPDVFNIFPVILATPDVACSILKLEEGVIDCIIIDEASQMFVDVAIPLIYRGKRLIVSGDREQMPPSAFFQSKNEDFDDNSNFTPSVTNEQSLLDAVDAKVDPVSKNKCRLLVHYRSDHKGLIDFSNHAFYEGTLISPSTNQQLFANMKAPIELIQVNGNFSESKNKEEAYKIIEILKEIWKSPNPPTLGVIVFNDKQKNLIDDLLQDECRIDDDFNGIFNREQGRKDNDESVGFFTRSVEHVQGDERDIIILGTVYGTGSRNYGPIIKEGGRKRLNVAITRAKKGMIVVTSLNIFEISNESAKDQKEIYFFWKFMEYAKAISDKDTDAIRRSIESVGSNVIPQRVYNKIAESPFEEAVAEYLNSLGYYVEHQVSQGSFRIDIGIKYNQTDATFICGIECDGRQYHSSWDARHNDIWRQKILESKGWKIARIWGDDWYGNKEKAKESLKERLKNI